MVGNHAIHIYVLAAASLTLLSKFQLFHRVLFLDLMYEFCPTKYRSDSMFRLNELVLSLSDLKQLEYIACRFCLSSVASSQPYGSTRQIAPIFPTERHICVRAGLPPQKHIIHPILLIHAHLVGINSLLAKPNLVLFMIVDMGTALYNPQKHGDGIAWKLFSRVFEQFCQKFVIRSNRQMQSRAARAAFMTWYRNSIYLN